MKKRRNGVSKRDPKKTKRKMERPNLTLTSILRPRPGNSREARERKTGKTVKVYNPAVAKTSLSRQSIWEKKNCKFKRKIDLKTTLM